MGFTSRVRTTLNSVMALFLVATSVLATAAQPVAAAPTSSRVAYIFDFGAGVNDPNFLGSSIFRNAVTGTDPGTANTPMASYNGATFTNVPVSTVDAAGVGALVPFDSVLVYDVCDIGNHPNTLTALNTFLQNGGKVMIFDADRCAPGSAGGLANYSTFLFPFATSSPGPLGASGAYTTVQPSTLTTGLVVGPQPFDSVGDANTFTTFNGSWCQSISARNALGNTGFVEAYARALPGNGLAVYEGEDFWFTDGANAHLKQVFDNILAQGWSPDGLPCQATASGITLSPASATNPVSQSHTVTATVSDVNGNPVPNVVVTFAILTGPDSGVTGNATTNASGQATFTYTNNGTTGTDSILARFTDAPGNIHTSNQATKTWTPVTLTLHSLVLNGIDGFAEAPDSALLNLTNDWTVETWFKDEDPGGFNHTFGQIIMKGDRNADPEAPFYMLVGFNHLLAGVRTGGHDYPIDINLAVLGLNPMAWHHVAVTFRGDLNVLNLWLDGKHIAFKSVPAHSTGNTLPLELGRNGPATGKYWRGKLDDVRVWRVARTGAQITANFMSEFSGAAPTGLVANWKFDESGGLSAADSADSHTATLHNGASFSTDVHS